MPNFALRTTLKLITIFSIIVLPIVSILEPVQAATTATTLNQAITAGTLSIAIVDAGGVVVSSPAITFSGVTFNFAAQNSTGTLGTTTQKIRLDNPTATAAWTVSMAATGGISTLWTDGGTNTYPFSNATADNGRLTVDPSVGTIAPWGSCTATAVTKGTSNYFVTATPSITLMTAAAGANTYCRWDLTGVALTQRIPASQAVANYTIAMTITGL